MFTKATLFLFSVVLLLASSTVDVEGQSALDGFDPNADGHINVVVVQPDGKILIGGGFTTLSPNGGGPVTRNYIARLNPDGTLDTAFNPNADGFITAIALQSDGKVLAGGSFTTIGGQTRNYIARLDATTGLADSFNPNANNDVAAIAVQADGKILAGGYFSNIGGQSRNFIARLDAITGLADSFNPNASGANNIVVAITVQADGQILAGGGFANIGGQPRNRIARLDAATGLADSFDPNASGEVSSIALQADGQILVGGQFTNIGGETRNYIARLDPTTGLADSFNPNANSIVTSIVVQVDGQIIVGGAYDTIGGQTRNNIGRLNLDGTLDTTFDPSANNTVRAVAVQADGKILAGGFFTNIGGQARNRITRLETDGTADQTLNLNIVGRPSGLGGDRPLGKNPFVFATVVQPDGKIIIGGKFTSVLGVTRNNMARLNTNGTLDTNFAPNPNNIVSAIVVQADGKILAGGAFTSIGGEPRNHIARLDATSGVADSFDPNANGEIDSIATQPDGRILVGGQFSGSNSIGGQTRNYIARLDPKTGLADSFDPNANGEVDSIATQPDGRIVVGGQFSGSNSIGGETRNYIARLDPNTGLADSFDPNANNEIDSIATQPDGMIVVGGLFTSIGGEPRNAIARLDPTGLADSFDPNANGQVRSISIQADGKILAGGAFTSINGQTRNYIARLDATTGLADSFNPIANGEIDSIATQPDGKILVGGRFGNIGGETRELFARLSNDIAALQNLAATQSTITWTRGGSSPQLTRVTFESSTDNLNYTPLGNGIPQGGSSNWILTGLNLPLGQNVYFRARGYHSGGLHNASESLTESVRQAFVRLNISGTISYCSNPVPGPVPNVTLNLSGDGLGQTLSDSSGNYTLSSVPYGGNHTVTPIKAARSPGSEGINTLDAIATQRHFLSIGTPLSDCRLTAADVNDDSSVNTSDVIAIQRFFLGLSGGIANVGKYRFDPASRTYSGIDTDQTGQDYGAFVLGDVVSGFVHRPEDPSQAAASAGMTAVRLLRPWQR